jgi:hypothetical protein
MYDPSDSWVMFNSNFACRKSSGRPCGKQFREYHTRTSRALFFDVLRQVSRLFLWSPYTGVLYLCPLVCGFEGRVCAADETWAKVIKPVADVWSAVNRGVVVRRLGWVGVVSWGGVGVGAADQVLIPKRKEKGMR